MRWQLTHPDWRPQCIWRSRSMAGQKPTALRAALLDALSKVQSLRAQLKVQQVEVATWPCEQEQSDIAPDQQLAEDRPCPSNGALSHPEPATRYSDHIIQQQLELGPATCLQLSPVFPQPPSDVGCPPDSPTHSTTQPSLSTRPSHEHSQDIHVGALQEMQEPSLQPVASTKLPSTPTRVGGTARLNRPQLSDSPILGKRKTNAKSSAVRSGVHNFSIKAVAAASRETSTVEPRISASPPHKDTATGRPTGRRPLSQSTASSRNRAVDDVALSRHTKPSAARQSESLAATATSVNSAANTPLGVRTTTATVPSNSNSYSSHLHQQSCNPSELRAFLASHIVTRHNALYDCEQEESPEPADGVTTVAALLQSCSTPAGSPRRQLLRSMDLGLGSLASTTSHRGPGTCSTPPSQHRLLRASVDTPSALRAKATSSAQKLLAMSKSARQAGVYASTSKGGVGQQATPQGNLPRSPSVPLSHPKTRSWLSDVGNIPTGKVQASLQVLSTEQSSTLSKAGDDQAVKASVAKAITATMSAVRGSLQLPQHVTAGPSEDSKVLLTSSLTHTSVRVATTPVKARSSNGPCCPSTPQPLQIDCELLG